MKTTFLIFGLILFGSCTKHIHDPSVSKSSGSNVEMTSLISGTLYGGGEENIPMQRLTITSQVQLDELLDKMNSVNYTWAGPENVDFSQFTLLAAFTEIKGNDGYSISFTSVTSDGVNITATATEAGTVGNAATVITQPFTFVKIPASSLPIIFN